MTAKARETCRFCRITASNSILSPFDRPIVKTEKHFAIPSLGGFVDGWTLICPVKHSVNMAREYVRNDFLAFAEEIHGLVSREFGHCVMFEHGAKSEGSATGCGTDHAHLHFVPLKRSLNELVRLYDPAAQWATMPLSDVAQRSGEHEYLLMADSFAGDRTEVRVQLLTSPRSQYFRHAIAAALGATHLADYRSAPLAAEAAASAARLRSSARSSLLVAA